MCLSLQVVEELYKAHAGFFLAMRKTDWLPGSCCGYNQGRHCRGLSCTHKVRD